MKEVQVFLDEFCVSLRRKYMTLQTRFVFQLEGDARLCVQSLCSCEDVHDCLDKVCVSIRWMCVTVCILVRRMCMTVCVSVRRMRMTV